MKKFWIGLAIGALGGGLAALLYAPQSGASTRRKVRRSIEDAGGSFSGSAEYLKAQTEWLKQGAQRLIDGGKGRFGHVLEAAQNYAKAARGQSREQRSRLM